MKTASRAPIGSLTIPSHLRMFETRGPTRKVRSIGPITVGPVTTNIPPNSAETSQLNPAP